MKPASISRATPTTTSPPIRKSTGPSRELKFRAFPARRGQRIRYGANQGDASPRNSAQNTFAFRDVLSKVVGPQTRSRLVSSSVANTDRDELIGGARPDQVFQGPWNFANGTPIFEQIEVNPITGDAPLQKPRYFRSSIYSAFAQNDWKLRPNLTVNLGLRWRYYLHQPRQTDISRTSFPGAAANAAGQ